METTVIRSARKTFSLQLKQGVLIVRAPLRATDRQIQALIAKHQGWITKAEARYAQQEKEQERLPPLTEEEIRALQEEAQGYIPQRVAHYAPLIGVTCGRITIRRQRSRWGSCSSKGNLSFNCLLMLTPPEVIDSVVVHELCHLKEMNHSGRFYAQVLEVYPAYQQWNQWLKRHGEAIIRRMTG